jgi:hypothetical protein
MPAIVLPRRNEQFGSAAWLDVRGQHRNLLWFAESEQYLICPAANARIENRLFVIILGITKLITMRFEHEPRRFDLVPHVDWIDSMQCLRIPQSRAGFGDMINY